jgi:hypothetical protein
MPVRIDLVSEQAAQMAFYRHPEKTVVIGFAEALSAPEVTWSLIDAGFHVIAFTRQGRRSPPLKRLKEVTLVKVAAQESNVSRTVDELCRIIDTAKPRAVLPLDDASILLCDVLSRKMDVPIAGPTKAQARLALDKRDQTRAAIAAGFIVPPTRYVTSREEALEISEFPVVLKPALAAVEVDGKLVGQKMYVCSDRHQLETSVRQWGAVLPMLAQPIVCGNGEGLFGFAGAQGVGIWSAHRRIRMMNPQGSGSSACKAQDITDQPTEEARRMLQGMNWPGMFMIELLRDHSNRVWFMELNGRSWGSMALARRMGYEYPVWTVMRALDPSFYPPNPSPRESVLCRHLGREIVHVLMVLKGKKPLAESCPYYKFRAILEVCRFSRRDRWYNYDVRSRSLFLEDALRTVLGQVVPRWR